MSDPLDDFVQQITGENSSLKADNERLNKEKEAAWDSAEYNARRAEAAEKENERLRKCCTQRGARMQIMREWMEQQTGLGGPGEWWYFCEERPAAADWFDKDGVPIDAAMKGG